MSSSLPFESNDITTEKVMAGLFALAIYFIPTIVGRDKKGWKYIFIGNLITGWTGIGWMIALLWAIKAKTKTVVPNLTYVDAIPEDATLLSATAINSKKTWGYTDNLMELWKPDLEVTPEYIAKNKVVKVFDKETFIGFFALKVLENNIAELDHLWLTPDSLRKSYGKEIFQHINAYLSLNGFSKMTLIAEPYAKGFYDKMGGAVKGQFESKISGRFLDIYEFQVE